jgi:hypothetical protein
MGLEEIQRIKSEAKMPKAKKVCHIPKKSAKKIEQEMNAKDNKELWEWFKKQRSKMTGVCKHCGERTMKIDDEKFHYSIAHILPKNIFPSVATHNDNWIELCYYGASCHSNLDNGNLDLIDLNCFNEVVEKFVRIYPSIAPEERRRIPQILMYYLETDK